MQPLSEFLDYREYLAEFYKWRKSENRRFSYRVLASRLDMNVSQLYRILNKRLHLPYTHLAKVCEALGLDEKGASHFELLVKYGRTHSKKERLNLIEQILARREVELRELKDDEFRVFAAWYAPVVRALAQMKGFDGSIGRIAIDWCLVWPNRVCERASTVSCSSGSCVAPRRDDGSFPRST